MPSRRSQETETRKETCRTPRWCVKRLHLAQTTLLFHSMSSRCNLCPKLFVPHHEVCTLGHKPLLIIRHAAGRGNLVNWGWGALCSPCMPDFLGRNLAKHGHVMAARIWPRNVHRVGCDPALIAVRTAQRHHYSYVRFVWTVSAVNSST